MNWDTKPYNWFDFTLARIFGKKVITSDGKYTATCYLFRGCLYCADIRKNP